MTSSHKKMRGKIALILFASKDFQKLNGAYVRNKREKERQTRSKGKEFKRKLKIVSEDQMNVL